VLGYGSHPDPASELVPAIEKAQGISRKKGRSLAVVASVCGTDEDPQGLERQEKALREAGVLLTESNASAARLAGALVAKLR
jgi:FdrA protein